MTLLIAWLVEPATTLPFRSTGRGRPNIQARLEDFGGRRWTVAFAVTDWSDERRTFKPFAEAQAIGD